MTFQREPHFGTFQNEIKDQQYGLEGVFIVTKIHEALTSRNQWMFANLEKVLETYIGLFDVGASPEVFSLSHRLDQWLFSKSGHYYYLECSGFHNKYGLQ